MNSTLMLIINWSLIIFGAMAIISAFRTLHKGTHKPIRVSVETIVSVIFFSVCITLWNQSIPVWIWWLLAAGISLLTGFTVIKTVKVR